MTTYGNYPTMNVIIHRLEDKTWCIIKISERREIIMNAKKQSTKTEKKIITVKPLESVKPLKICHHY